MNADMRLVIELYVYEYTYTYTSYICRVGHLRLHLAGISHNQKVCTNMHEAMHVKESAIQHNEITLLKAHAFPEHR